MLRRRKRRPRYLTEDFGRLGTDFGDYKRYTHLEGDKRAAFARLAKSPRRAFLLAFLLGGFGAHRLYLAQYWPAGLIFALGLASVVTTITWVFILAAVVYLIELGTVVRRTERWNDSLEGALMLEHYTKPLFRSAAP